jgi:type III pantothenate kinase
MIICVDLGNTTTTIGLMDRTETKAFWRVSTRERTNDEYRLLLSSLMGSERDRAAPDRAGLCSVVPSETESMARAVAASLGVEVKIVDGKSDCGVEVAVDNPEGVGGDRIANAAGAYYDYGGPAIVVDAGTAMTFDYVTAEGRYVGGVIAPGILAGARDLWSRARMLPAVETKKPDRVIGTTTIACMQSGIFFGALGEVEGIVRRMWEEAGSRCRVLLTGGQAVLIKDDLPFEAVYDPYLTLKGIAYAVDRGLRNTTRT